MLRVKSGGGCDGAGHAGGADSADDQRADWCEEGTVPTTPRGRALLTHVYFRWGGGGCARVFLVGGGIAYVYFRWWWWGGVGGCAGIEDRKRCRAAEAAVFFF